MQIRVPVALRVFYGLDEDQIFAPARLPICGIKSEDTVSIVHVLRYQTKTVKIRRYVNITKPKTLRGGKPVYSALWYLGAIFLKRVAQKYCSLDSTTQKYQKALWNTYNGKGSPAEIKRTIELYEFIKAYSGGHGTIPGYVPSSFRYYCGYHLGCARYAPYRDASRFYGVDCLGFVTSYLHDKYGARIRWGKYTKINTSEEWFFVRGTHRSQVSEIRPDDVVIWGEKTRRRFFHVAVVDSVVDTPSRRQLILCESGYGIREFKTYVEKKGTKHGRPLFKTTGFRPQSGAWIVAAPRASGS